MGYHTDFKGQFKISPALTKERKEFLKKFNETRRMQRDPIAAEKLSDPIREAVNLPVGDGGGYFVGGTGDFGQGNDDSVMNYNSPTAGQPGLWC